MLIRIPIEIVELDSSSFHLFVEGFINGIPCSFIIDTGASKTVFALHHLQPILLEETISQPEIQSAGIAASAVESHSGVINHFQLGNLSLRNMDIILIDLTSIDDLYHRFTSKSIWGLIGSDFLLTYKAKLDYGSKILTLKVPKANVLVV